MNIKSGTLGATIRKYRVLHGLSQEELAEAVGISPTHLKHIESEHRKPSVEVLFQLVRFLHISLDAILLPQEDLRSAKHEEIHALLQECSESELAIVCDIMRSLLKNRGN